jgi:hypothetical protein
MVRMIHREHAREETTVRGTRGAEPATSAPQSQSHYSSMPFLGPSADFESRRLSSSAEVLEGESCSAVAAVAWPSGPWDVMSGLNSCLSPVGAFAEGCHSYDAVP